MKTIQEVRTKLASYVGKKIQISHVLTNKKVNVSYKVYNKRFTITKVTHKSYTVLGMDGVLYVHMIPTTANFIKDKSTDRFTRVAENAVYKFVDIITFVEGE